MVTSAQETHIHHDTRVPLQLHTNTPPWKNSTQRHHIHEEAQVPKQQPSQGTTKARPGHRYPGTLHRSSQQNSKKEEAVKRSRHLHTYKTPTQPSQGERKESTTHHNQSKPREHPEGSSEDEALHVEGRKVTLTKPKTKGTTFHQTPDGPRKLYGEIQYQAPMYENMRAHPQTTYVNNRHGRHPHFHRRE